jgi:hypothetical protein
MTFSLLALGCSSNDKKAGDPEAVRRNSELAEIYEIYMQFVKANQRAPKQFADLNKKQFQGMFPVALKALQDGDYVAVWGVELDKASSGKVLAYEKGAPENGGVVLIADGTVKTMTASELQGSLKQ